MFKSLRSRLIVLLSLAVLPLGLIAVQQSVQVIRDARTFEEQDLLARTFRAAADEEELLRESFGAARALGIAALSVDPDSPTCDAMMLRFVEMSPEYVFAGFLTPDGVLRCSTEGQDIDFSDSEEWANFVASPNEVLDFSSEGRESGVPVVIATVPVFERNTNVLLGAASISVPETLSERLLSGAADGLDLALIDSDGDILASGDTESDVRTLASLGLIPSDLDIPADGLVLPAEMSDLRDRIAVLVPILGADVYIVGLWRNDSVTYVSPGVSWTAPLFPILMWIAAMVVALLALDRLVLRHLRQIRGSMGSFSVEEPIDQVVELDHPPVEIEQIAGTYNRMVQRIVADHAQLTENLTEKELLVREVHHRVKNNLQLIASILNMQIRALGDGQEKRTLRRVQDRIMSLSVVHRTLYSGVHVGEVRADQLVSEVIASTFAGGLPSNSGIRTTMDVDRVFLNADQAVPLALLANEAVTNAVKYVGRGPGRPAEVSVRLKMDEENRVVLSVRNTVGDRVIEGGAAEPGGLGSRLIEAFSAQLDGELVTNETDEHHDITLTFRAIEEVEHENGADSAMRFYGSTGAGPANDQGRRHG